jgi:DNA-binding NarL/FixJ family response regulator
MKKLHRIVIVADNPAISADFRTSLEAQPDLTLAAAVTCASCSFNAVSKQQADLVLISLDMPGHRILELVKDLAVLHAGLKFLVVSRHGQELDPECILRAGAHGCVTSGSSTASKLAAVRQILAGRHCFSPQATSRPSAASLHPTALAFSAG